MTDAIHTTDGGALAADPDVAEAFAGHSWAPVAGRYIATIDNNFFDLQSLIGGPCAVPSPASPADFRRSALEDLHFEPAQNGCAARLSALRLQAAPEIRGIDVAQRPDVSAYAIQGERHDFVPMDAAFDVPNVAIDSLANAATVLTLSHWPGNRTPAAYRADLSAQSVFQALEISPSFPVRVVTSDHFDVDGAVGLAAALWPDWAMPRRALLTDIAGCGDFQTFEDPLAARICYAINRLSSPFLSPMAQTLRELGPAARHAFLFSRILPMMRELVAKPDDFEALWKDDAAVLEATERAFAGGAVELSEDAAADLAIFRIRSSDPPPGSGIPSTLRYGGYAAESFHNRTRCSNIAIERSGAIEIWQRYTSWVEAVTFRPLPRRDLVILEQALNRLERSGGKWNYGGVTQFMPRLKHGGAKASTLSAQAVLEMFLDFQRVAPAAWSP